MLNYIKDYRNKLNITQQELADKVNVSRQTINSMEKNKYRPSVELAIKIAIIFKVKVEELFII
jgi:putative transcriptional regulator